MTGDEQAETWEHRFGRLPVPVPAAVPALPMQFAHEEDVGRALLLCVRGVGPPGAYNIPADEILTAADVARELGVLVALAAVRAEIEIPGTRATVRSV